MLKAVLLGNCTVYFEISWERNARLDHVGNNNDNDIDNNNNDNNNDK